MEYNFREIEQRWQQWWKDNHVYKVNNPEPGDDHPRPKCYVLDMFPYPSGAGLHVGHPLGYIASDIYARYKRLKGFHVLHPMGYDAFGLPAEQYAMEHGIHPALSTENNINNFRRQLDNIGFSYDWDREVRTCDPKYYKWTQWIFLQLFQSFYNRQTNRAEPISNLIASFEKEGNAIHPFPSETDRLPATFSSDEWKNFDEKTRQDILMQYRLAYCGVGEVNWCEALGTVLANDEVVNGVSERGGYPVVKKKMRQWYLRITEYADRLLEGLETVEFSESMKEMQRNWIGKSEGAIIKFQLRAPSRPFPAGMEGLHTAPGYRTAQPSLYKLTKDLAKENRHTPTHEESMLWERLKNNQTGFHIQRQHIIGSYIVDFACLDKLVTIEIDGGYHLKPEQKNYDEEKTRFLKERGFTELRFKNEEIRNNIEKVIETIVQKLNSLPSVPKKAKAEKAFPEGESLDGAYLPVYTTRPDTIFGVDFMVLAPEHELVQQITTDEQKKDVEKYLEYVNSRSERERMAEKKITGVFTGSCAIHPFSGREIPIWISEYVLAGYGTGAIMAVPCGDERDHRFAKHFNIPITNIIGSHYNGEEANPTYDAILENSDFLNGLPMKDAIEIVINKLEETGLGIRKVQYKIRDAVFSRQRYWGEPFPIVWKDGIAYPLQQHDLPVELPHMDEIKPGPEGEGPLANLTEWVNTPSFGGSRREVNTMPGYAGSSWYFLRYMDPHNDKEFCSRRMSDYWNQVDLYIGGTEHAVGHLLYSRMWTKVLYDLGWIGFDEPFKKLVNQGMITGRSFFFQLKKIDDPDPAKAKMVITSYAKENSTGLFLRFKYGHKLVDSQGRLTRNALVKAVQDGIVEHLPYEIEWGSDDAIFLKEESEKMSKSKFNVDNPDDIIEKYGADTFRMYEMFLGPIEQSKPWDTQGIEGVHRFLKKCWRLFADDTKGLIVTDQPATLAELKVLHKTIRKVEEDTERFSFHTAVSAFMICVNELTELQCHKKEILEPLLILLAPYAPHMAEELWHALGHTTSVVTAAFPAWQEIYLAENRKEYPVSVNGKLRTRIIISLEASQEEVEKIVLANEVVKKWLNEKPPRKIIYVKGRMVNVVV